MKKLKTLAWVASIFPWVFAFGLVSTLMGQSQKKHKILKEMLLHSKSFQQNELIPSKYTCDGINISPSLEWSGFPSETKSFALICDDPDAPSGTWVHWVLYNIPVPVTELPENFLLKNKSVKGILGGMNDFGKLEYGGPCPPGGTHRYFFKIYALDTFLAEKEGISASTLVKAMEGHILAKGDLMGKYSRK
jgi:Raf kinase inhibitor-like YbhB/YbcL family protein